MGIAPGGPVRIDLDRVASAVGRAAYGRGRAYARDRRVLHLEWDADDDSLSARVVGQGQLYDTAAYFTRTGAGRLRFEEGECTCPVGWNCKHVAAIVIASVQASARPPTAPPPPAPVPAPVAPTPAWEVHLRALVEAPQPDAASIPMAIELTMAGGGAVDRGGQRLLARLMRASPRGGWVNGSLTWNGLDSWQVSTSGLRDDHLMLARELCALHQASQRGPSSYRYGYRPEKQLDLSECGPHLWSLLDEAHRIGLPLIHAQAVLGELARPVQGEIVVDVTRPDGAGAVVRAVLRVDGDDAAADTLTPVQFLGTSGHGLVGTDRPAGPGQRLRLVRLARPAPPALRRLVLDAAPVVVPAGELDRFARELSPALGRVAPVVSSDGSFTPPEVAPPVLGLRARYREGHALDLSWQWLYRVDDAVTALPVSGGPHPLRDPAAEAAALLEAELGTSGLDALGLVDQAGRPVAEPVTVIGLAAMHFTTEVLPSLAGTTIVVEIEGTPADYRDVGDLLEIGVSADEVAGTNDWFDLGVTISVDGRELPIAEVLVGLTTDQPHLLLDDGAHFSLTHPTLQTLRQLIDEARQLVDSPSAPLRISRYQAGLWAELVALGHVTREAEAWRRQADALLGLDSFGQHDPPPSLLAELRPYQREGFAWLASLWGLGLGGILADDMGLGKTLQTLALICHARQADPDVGPFLIVAPTSVVSNWVSEAAQFAPKLDVVAVTDTFAKSGRSIDDVAEAHVVVTTYTLLRLDAEPYTAVRWAGVVLDEAQNVKNHQSKTYRCVRELSAASKVALTGTPMENNLLELWSLLSITAPGLFPDPKRFTEQYARPIERGGDRERLDRLRRRIKPLVKRRTKELVAADLPAKQEQTLEIELSARHRKLYDTHLQRERQRVLGLIGDFDRNRMTILRSITKLRQLSLHPGLVDERHRAVPCAKLDALAEQLDDVIGGGHRALMFSQFTSFLSMVRDSFDRQGIGYCYLDGRTRQRDKVIDRFRTGDDPAFLISLKAGGVGLNLTEADYCFLLDPWWNPAAENQAIDRTHRIGQTRPVLVYRMVAHGTIEEKVVALAQRKAALFRGVMDEGDLLASTLTADDVRELFD